MRTNDQAHIKVLEQALKFSQDIERQLRVRLDRMERPVMDTTYIGFGSLLCLRQFAGRGVPLSERLAAGRVNLSGMFNAGELAGLPDDTQLQLRGLELFLCGAADETKEKEL